MREASSGDIEGADRRNGVSGDLRFLTAETFSCPTTRIFSDTWPDELGAHGLACALNPRMSKSVDDVEDAASESERNKWSEWTIAGVDDQF